MIILSCPEGFPGVKQFFKGLECHFSNQITCWTPSDQNLLNKINQSPEVDTLFLGSWDNSYIKILEKIPNGIKIYFTWHSPFLQTALSGEEGKLAHLLNLVTKNIVDGIILADLRLYEFFKDLYPNLNTYYLPVIIDTRDLDLVVNREKDSISLFGPDAPRKNLYTQLLAGFALSEKTGLNFQTNVYTENYITDLPNVHIKRTSQWLERSLYLELASRTKMGLCVTCSESFNYNLWEYLYLGSKVVTSKDQLSYIKRICESVGIKEIDIPEIIVAADLNDPHEIVQQALKLIHHEGGNQSTEFVKSFNIRTIGIARPLLAKFK
jgi:hypothetical protein